MYEFIDKRSNKSLWKLIGNNKMKRKKSIKELKKREKII